MRSSAALLLTLTSTIAAQTIGDLPECAINCFARAVGLSGCAPSDSYCQCTTGAAKIRQEAVSCLCGSESECSVTELMKAQQVSNGICSAALSASGEAYTAATVGMDVCQATGGAGSGTKTAASTEANQTGSSPSDSDSEGASPSVEAQTDNAAPPAVTGMTGLQGAVMGVFGLGIMAL